MKCYCCGAEMHCTEHGDAECAECGYIKPITEAERFEFGADPACPYASYRLMWLERRCYELNKKNSYTEDELDEFCSIGVEQRRLRGQPEPVNHQTWN